MFAAGDYNSIGLELMLDLQYHLQLRKCFYIFYLPAYVDMHAATTIEIINPNG
jgi:hypothetical protein